MTRLLFVLQRTLETSGATTGYESSHAKQIAPPSCHPERKNAKRFEVEVLRRRSKTEERSDDGIYEGIPTAFHRKLTSLEKRYQESLEDPNAAPYEEYVRSPGAEI